MSEALHYRRWDEDPPVYGDNSGLFSVEVVHNGFFCGLGVNLSYVSASSAFFDNCCSDTWSNFWLDEILTILGYKRDGKLHVYWCLPDKEINEGLVSIQTDADIVQMIRATATNKTLLLFLDHTNFLRNLREDVIIHGGPTLPPVISPDKVPRAVPVQAVSVESEDSSLAVVVASKKCGVDSDSDSEFEFYDSDYNVEEGDDDLFLDNVDTEVNDHNEKVVIEDLEDDDALEDDDLQLGDDEREKLKSKFRAFNPQVDMDNPVFRVGQMFSDVKEVRQAVEAYSIRGRVKLRKVKNDKRRLEVVCEVGCPWLLKAAKDSRTGGFVITAHVAHHTCEKVWQLKALTAKFLKLKFMNEFRDNQKMDLKTFAAKVQREFSMCPDRWKLGRARKAALLEIHGDEEAQFSLLWDYGQELRRSNPGSKFFLSTNSVNDPGSAVPKEHLATLYWSYDACKRGFLAGCRPLICIDGCHIKTRYKGQLLTAVGIDPNDCIFPIAMGLVEVECTSSWEWFLTTLRDDLNITNTSPWTIMSDKQKGLIKSVQKVFPDAEHRFCVRHMIQNFQKAGHRGENLKNDMWAIARSTNIPKWQASMDKLKADSELAYEWVEQLVPSTWIKAFFSDFPKCDILLNNHSEVFNSYILEARENPILSMLETIFYKLMQRIESKQREALKWPGRICPKIKKKLEKFTEWSAQCFVKPAGNSLFSVSSHEMERHYTVDIKAKTCDCKRWQLTGIPCHHAIACCRTDRINPESLVHSCYTIDTFLKAYGHNLVPLRGRAFWEKMNGAVVHAPLYTKVMGRPKKSRKKAPEEKIKKGVTIFTKAGVTIHCSICGEANHNKKGHQKFVQSQLEKQQQEIHEPDEDFDIPEIMQSLIQQNPNPAMDPTNQMDSMVYRLGQEETSNVPISRVHVPLPENCFVAAARERIPKPVVRVTTASTRGQLRGRGGGRSTTARGRTSGTPQEQPVRAEAKGKKRTAQASTSGTAQINENGATGRGRTRRKSYNTGPGSAHYLLFGDEQQPTQEEIPDLNADLLPNLNAHEVPVSQNAPTGDGM